MGDVGDINEKKSMFHLFYLSRPWPKFKDTLLGACQKAFEVSKKHADVKLIGPDGEVDFRKILEGEA